MTDFLGNPLNIGDYVVVNSRGFNKSLASFELRTVAGFTAKFILLNPTSNQLSVNKTTSNLLVKYQGTT